MIIKGKVDIHCGQNILKSGFIKVGWLCGEYSAKRTNDFSFDIGF